MDFISYYPYKGTISNSIVALDLADQTNQSSLDFMTASEVVGKSKADPNVVLEFSHLLSKVILNVTSIEIADLSALSVVVQGMNSEAKFNLFEADFYNQSNVLPITALKNETSFELTLLPTSLTPAHTIDFVVNGSTYTWNISDDISELKGGNKYVYDITLSPTFTSVSTSGTIKARVDNTGNVNVSPKAPSSFRVGDYYPDPLLDSIIADEKAKTQGIVFEVSSDGKSGKILSLVESSGLVWGTKYSGAC